MRFALGSVIARSPGDGQGSASACSPDLQVIMVQMTANQMSVPARTGETVMERGTAVTLELETEEGFLWDPSGSMHSGR